MTRAVVSPKYCNVETASALATARSVVLKGAHFVAAVAFMFASTNLLIELGVLILLFLGWKFLAAAIVGGLLLIVISRSLVVATYAGKWLKAAREKVEDGASPEEDDFDWKSRINSKEGWLIVGHRFAMEWRMAWQEILIGFIITGLVAVLVPARVWETLFLVGQGQESGLNVLVAVENALLAPFIVAATFIGSMGNIPSRRC